MSETMKRCVAGFLGGLLFSSLLASGAVLEMQENDPATSPEVRHVAAKKVRPCKHEDGPGRCVWDARHRGNGKGKSYIVRRNETTKRISHRRAHRLVKRWRRHQAAWSTSDGRYSAGWSTGR